MARSITEASAAMDRAVARQREREAERATDRCGYCDGEKSGSRAGRVYCSEACENEAYQRGAA